MLNREQQSKTLQRLAAIIRQSGMHVPVGIALDIVQPFDVLSSHVALFCKPFTMGSSFERYVLVLADEASWAELRRYLGRSEC